MKPLIAKDEFDIASLILMMTAVGDDDSRQQTLQACADKAIPSMPQAAIFDGE